MNSQSKIVIAIDGYSSSGKSTMARELARKIGYIYVDSGAMYRALTLFALREGLISSDGSIDTQRLINRLPDADVSFGIADADTGVAPTLLNGENVEKEIRGMEVSSFVSPVSAIPEVRHRLTLLQQKMGEKKGIVMDGRDIGTTVFPTAEMKVFVEASPEVRAERRYKELTEKGVAASLDEVLENIRSRDYTDTHRTESPLRKASDAFVLENDYLTREEQMEILLNLYHRLTSNAHN